MKISDRFQNADLRVLVKLMKPVAALLGCLALFVPGAVLSAATVEYDLTIAQQKVNFTPARQGDDHQWPSPWADPAFHRG